MKKFLAVLKREYKKVVFTWTFLITTFLMPLLAAFFIVVPMLIFSIEGEQTRIAIIDPSGKIAGRLKKNLSSESIAERTKKKVEESSSNLGPSQNNQLEQAARQIGANFGFVDYDPEEKSADEIKKELNGKIAADELDAYLILPKDFDSNNAEFQFYSRKAGDFLINSALEDGLNDAVRSQRLADADISEEQLQELSRKIRFTKIPITKAGEEKDKSTDPLAGFLIATLLMTILLVYGQAIMAAIVEEKETKISEVLFSSAKPFELLMGKLVGVGLAGLTQLGIWILTLGVVVAFGLVNAMTAGVEIPLPSISGMTVVYFLLFFLIGFFIYSTIYALIGSMVTNMQEGGQLVMPPVMLLVVALYFCFAVVRDPNSTMSFWVSIAPFFAPIVMPVRILAEVPPFWQIALAIVLNILTVFGLTWIAARVYRIGMLMYGKRATIPEVWKWIRQI